MKKEVVRLLPKPLKSCIFLCQQQLLITSGSMLIFLQQSHVAETAALTGCLLRGWRKASDPEGPGDGGMVGLHGHQGWSVVKEGPCRGPLVAASHLLQVGCPHCGHLRILLISTFSTVTLHNNEKRVVTIIANLKDTFIRHSNMIVLPFRRQLGNPQKDVCSERIQASTIYTHKSPLLRGAGALELNTQRRWDVHPGQGGTRHGD